MLLTGRRLHFAPIGENPQHIIDLGKGHNSKQRGHDLTWRAAGTGTGIWAISSKLSKSLRNDFVSSEMQATKKAVDASKWQTSFPPPRW
jgi:hypothetical protein